MKCNNCGKDTYLGFECKRCGGYFCAKDRLPENHNCAFKDMRNDEIQLRRQLEKQGGPKAERPPQQYNETPVNEKNYYADKTEPKPYEEDDEENSSGRYVARGPVGGDLTLSLMIFVVFAIMDTIFLLFTPTFFMFLPIIVHVVFLPFLFYIAYKQKRGEFPPRIVVTFIQVIITYMVVYMAAEVVVAFTMGNFVMIGIYLVIGVMMVLVWSRVLQQLKYVFGGS
nr:AN1-type zinc finger domain-containing protein [Candidatus Sigynarchaeota archaeon]